MYIKKVILHNFQSHKHTEVEFDKGLNVIVGETDQGKTSLAERGIKWCLFNEPQGGDFVRFKDSLSKKGEAEREDLCYVTIEFDNDIILTRKRIKKKNIYELTNEYGEIMSYENFGNSVPPDILNTLGIRKLQVDEDFSINLNIIGAKDTSLIYESNNKKSKVLGAFGGANTIDVAIRDIQTDSRNISQEKKILDKELETLDEEIKTFGDMNLKEELVKQIDNLFFTVSETDYIKSEIISLNTSINNRLEIIKNDKNFIRTINVEDTEKTILYFEQLLIEVKDLVNLQSRLITIQNRINNRKNIIKTSKEDIQRYKNIGKEELNILNIENTLNNTINKISNTNNKRTNMNTLISKIKVKKANIKKYNAIIYQYKDIDKIENIVQNVEENINIIQNKINDVLIKKEKIVILYENINQKRSTISAGKKYLEENEKNIRLNIDECLSLIKGLGKCPTCLSDINDEQHMIKVRKELESL